jgi:hypothetical protein
MTLPAVARLRRAGADVSALISGSLALLAVAAAVGLWAAGLTTIELSGMNDLGLVSVLPPVTIAGPLLLTASFAFVLVAQPLRAGLILLHVLVLVVMLYALPTIVEDAPRFNVAWRHLGISEVLTRTGGIDPEIDAYFSWPGFFALSALLTEIAGPGTSLDLIAWTPVVVNLLYLPPLLLILRAASPDQRVVWLAVWFFYLTNWIGQDYYAPQAFAYFLYLVIIAIVLTWFGRDPDPIRPLPRSWFLPFKPVVPPLTPPLQRAALFGILIGLFAIVVASHQLTPFAILGVVLTLVVLRRITTSGLPIVMIVIIGTWLSYMTVSYLEGHLRDLVDRIGSVDTTVAANLTDRFTGSEQHLFVLGVRSATTVVLWGLAAIGTLRRLGAGDRDLTWPFLAVAPFVLILLQEYGGEILLRIYLFSLPFMALLAANAVLGFSFRRGWLPLMGIVLTGVVLLGGFLVSRYGNERMDLITTAEEAGMRRLYEIAPHGSLLVAASDNVFWRFRDYELYDYAIVTDEFLASDFGAVEDRLAAERNGSAFLVLSRSQRAAFELRHGMDAGEWTQLMKEIESLPGLSRVFDNGDVEIYEMASGAPG